MLRLAVVVVALVAACDQGKKDSPAPAAPPAAPPTAPAPAPAPASTPPSGISIGKAAGLIVENSAGSAQKLACEEAARDIKGTAGTSWYMTCPSGCKDVGGVWGTGVYTDDSRICPAAIHAGAITAEQGGTVLVTWASGQPTYIGSAQNGVTTSDYGAWGRSFYVQKIDVNGKPLGPSDPPLVTQSNTAHLSCHHNAIVLTGAEGAKWNVDCPAGCEAGALWGSNPYTGDSVVCSAALHAGVIDMNGGKLVVTIEGKKPSFQGTSNHGITSNSYGPWARSFRVAKP